MARLMLAMAVVGLLIAGAAAGQTSRQSQLEQVWGQELEESTPTTKVKEYVSPVKRVVNLLNKMKGELEAEADKESEMYDKMVCWCETNEKEKTKSIANLEAQDEQLSTEIETRSARFGQLTASIQKTKAEIAENTEMLDKATNIRESEAAEFRGEEKDMVQAVTNLRNAIAVLSKHQKTQDFLQIDGSLLSGMRVLLRDASLKYEVLVASHAERRGAPAPTALMSLKAETARSVSGDADGVGAALLSALNIHAGSVSDDLPVKFAAQLVEQAAHAQSGSRTFLQMGARQPLYESRSSARSAGIYGVMNQMLEEFEAELSASQKEELKSQEDYKALAAAKTAQIDAGKSTLDEMQEEDAGNAKALSDAKEDLEITRNQRSEDVEFLRNLKLTCIDLDDQWEKRSKTRAAETKAVAEAIAVLTEDDNREMLAKSVKLLQENSEILASEGLGVKRSSAAALLRHAAQAPEFEADDLLAAWHGRHGASRMVGAAAGPRAQLSTLAMAVQLDSFTKVKKMMDTMMAELKEQQAEEVKFKDYCQTEFRTTEKTVFDKNELKKDLETKIDQLEALIKKLRDEIAEAKSQVAATEVGIKKASQSREEENTEFQSVVADQRATQSILKKALMKLKDFYTKAVLAQRSAQTPPVQFNDYKANAGSSPVMGLIEQILEDSKTLEAETTAAETKAQADYEAFVKDSNALIKSLQDAITSKTKAVAAADSDKADASADLESTVDELESLAAYEADLHAECDFVLKNFDIRQQARKQEMEAIQSAKAILSGSK
mmetsp:Transcript_63167/g.159336  ORF Transcript_63167/g.159336 Transcript_63167/m.159336 type:complete len:780 (-) Transcript_63167:113-2452(-)|eukprot:CAMPEP_0115302376 /NCGR_PEP_ID=MMETSP0270-20121206/70352_1 /TAXON_ID=71861 /ORGANISM="Scrippsiella trochoidea, Strain CCMP3099" /LENGTH=779 /DNA_ID=CAMNT_0002720303 /DNA_START=6 /DNA_END=2345 /DNA_ORIENTATION=-